MSGRLAGRVAFITGAGSGIARAASLLFAREGASVAVAELDEARGRATEEAIRAAGGDAAFVPTDVTDEESVRNAVAAAVARFGQLDVLYSCAGGSVADDGPATTAPFPSVWDRTIPLDLLGTYLCARHAIPELVRAGGGSVVNTASAAALKGGSTHVYAAAKGGVISLTRALASTYARDRVRVNVICPGMVLTDRMRGRFEVDEGGAATMNDDYMRRRYENHPFAIGQPEDLANVALFLASDESRMVTGAVIAADGGLSAY